MEDRVRSASKLPKVLLPQVARILCGLPEERLPEELKWRQVEGAHYAGSVLELHLEPEIPFKDDLHMPDGIHCQQITMAHGTSWQAAHGILSEGLLRPQASRAASYPAYGAFGKGTCEPFGEATANKAIEAVARKAHAQSIIILVAGKAHAVQPLEGGIDRLQSAVRRDFAARSASDGSMCLRSEVAVIRGICFLWPR